MDVVRVHESGILVDGTVPDAVSAVDTMLPRAEASSALEYWEPERHFGIVPAVQP